MGREVPDLLSKQIVEIRPTLLPLAPVVSGGASRLRPVEVLLEVGVVGDPRKQPIHKLNVLPDLLWRHSWAA